MKKVVAILACLATASTHGMEIIPKNKDKANSWNITFGKTVIYLTKGSISSVSGKTDLMVVGRNQQQTLRKTIMNDSLKVTDYSTGSVLYEKDKEDESASDDDTYKPYSLSIKNTKQKFWEKAHKNIMNNIVMTIVEPRIVKEVYYNKNHKRIEGFLYYVHRPNPENKNSYFECAFEEDEAIEEATEDLIRCYLIALLDGRQNKIKNIAFSTLSTEVGFPREEAAQHAIGTIVGFIEKEPEEWAYDCIELFVKKRSEFELYKNLLQQYAAAKYFLR